MSPAVPPAPAPATPTAVSAVAALAAVSAGAAVMASPYCATPTTLLAALAGRSREIPNLVLSAGVLLGDAPYFEEVLTGQLTFRTWHVDGPGRKLAAADAVDYIPIRARDVVPYLRSRVDVALVRVTPPDARGFCSLGPSASYTKAMLEAARIRIAEIDPDLPRTLGPDVTYPYAAFDYVVDVTTPTSTYRQRASSEVCSAVADQVIPLLRDEVTLQLGIGSVPEAIARSLADSDLRGLRLVGMIGDPMVELAERGLVSDLPHAIQAVEILGTERVFSFAHENPAVEMLSSAAVHDVGWLAGQPSLVSVCSALAVDLTGQAASEQIGERLMSGVGGSADFFDGARLSPGGIRVLALTARTSGGESRISTSLLPGTPVTLPRHSIDYVVTEYGAASLAGRSLHERAEALIGVAAPEHRDTLWSEWAFTRAGRKEKA